MWPEVAGRVKPVTGNKFCAALSILAALGFVSDREFFQGGFSLGEEADGKAVTLLCP